MNGGGCLLQKLNGRRWQDESFRSLHKWSPVDQSRPVFRSWKWFNWSKKKIAILVWNLKVQHHYQECQMGPHTVKSVKLLNCYSKNTCQHSLIKYYCCCFCYCCCYCTRFICVYLLERVISQYNFPGLSSLYFMLLLCVKISWFTHSTKLSPSREKFCSQNILT